MFWMCGVSALDHVRDPYSHDFGSEGPEGFRSKRLRKEIRHVISCGHARYHKGYALYQLSDVDVPQVNFSSLARGLGRICARLSGPANACMSRCEIHAAVAMCVAWVSALFCNRASP